MRNTFRLTIVMAVLILLQVAFVEAADDTDKSDRPMRADPLTIGQNPTVITGEAGTVFIDLKLVNFGTAPISDLKVSRISLRDSKLRAPNKFPLILGELAVSSSTDLQASFQREERDDEHQERVANLVIRGTFVLAGKLTHFSLRKQFKIPADPKISLATNGTDPLLVEIRSGTGDTVEYFGEKIGGMVTAFSSVAVTHSDGKVTRYTVDAQGKPLDAEAADGSSGHFTWVTDTSGVATFVSADSAEHLSIAFDLNNIHSGTAAGGTLKTAVKAMSNQSRFRGTFLPPPIVAGCAASPNSPQNSAAIAGPIACGENNVCTQVIHCGPEDHANVQVHVSSVTQAYDLPASLLAPSTGIYASSVPTPNNALSNIPSLCSSAASFLSNACIAVPVFSALCAEISLLTGAAPAFAFCIELLGSSEIACALLGGTGGPPGGPSPAQQLCTDIQALVDRALNAPITLEPIAQLPGAGTLLGTAVQTPPNPPFPLLNVTFPEATLIPSFTADPVDPPATVGYVATANITCAPPGTVVNLSISGTDGFTEATSCTIQGNASCTMFVPGAATAGIIDTLTAQVVGGPSATAVNVFQ